MEQMIKTEEALRIKIGKKILICHPETISNRSKKDLKTDKFTSSDKNSMKIMNICCTKL